ncbi:MAG: hypothetical protein M1819_006674 [Sarea resinae]|nr:MAG: hypothetical protein M1819_006674 [Sarea resinae]
MNYPPPQGPPGYPPYGSPSPQPGYGAPPPVPNHPYPNQGPPPNQYQQYPPNAGYSQAAPPYPPHPSQAGGYGQGPPQPYYPQQQQQQGYGGYPPGPQYPPQQPYGQPPQQAGYGAPPNPYGPPPPNQYAQAAPPSPGYIPNASAPYDATAETSSLRRAMKGFGTDEKTLIRVLCRPDALSMATIRTTYTRLFSRSLETDLAKETSGYFEETLLALARGPLAQDVHLLHQSIAGAGTNEALLNDVLLSRSNADLLAIKALYHATYHVALEKAVADDLSLKTARLFAMVLTASRAEPSAPTIPQQLSQHASDMHRATEGRPFAAGTDTLEVCRLLTTLSDPQLAALAQTYERTYAAPLRKVLHKHFSGHMRDAFLYILDGATDRAARDAALLEETMKGPGTKDVLLLNRVVRAHWDRAHLENVKRAYQASFRGKDLVARVRGDTSGDYERLLCAVLDPSTAGA